MILVGNFSFKQWQITVQLSIITSFAPFFVAILFFPSRSSITISNKPLNSNVEWNPVFLKQQSSEKENSKVSIGSWKEDVNKLRRSRSASITRCSNHLFRFQSPAFYACEYYASHLSTEIRVERYVLNSTMRHTDFSKIWHVLKLKVVWEYIWYIDMKVEAEQKSM